MILPYYHIFLRGKNKCNNTITGVSSDGVARSSIRGSQSLDSGSNPGRSIQSPDIYYSIGYRIMKPIYDIEREVETVKESIENSGLPDNVKAKIFEFVSFVRESVGITKHREYFYLTRLKVLAGIMGESILNPTMNQVISAIAKLRDTTTNRGTPYSPASMSDFKKVLKKFVKYANDGELPKFWSDIHAEKIDSRYNSSDSMITYDELQSLLKACKNNRDKAIISLLWDSGIRASELLQLKVRNFRKSVDQMYATLEIEKGSKNYKPRIVVITGDSVVLVPQWIDELKGIMKDTFSEDGYLFIGIGKENTASNLSYDDLRMMLHRVWERSGLTKKISPHLFRHSAATRFAVEMPTQVFTKQMGWSSNKMADNYTHLDTRGQITAILKAQGIEITEEELKKPVSKVARRCPRCHVINTGGARFCSNCGSPMKAEDFQKAEEERIKVMDAVKESNLISQDARYLLENTSEEGQLDLLATLLLKMEKEGKLEELKKRVKKP